MRLPGAPLKCSAGAKRIKVAVSSSRALLSDTSVAIASQLSPSQYCHVPCMVVAALPTIATPPNELAASPPPEIAVFVSVASL